MAHPLQQLLTRAQNAVRCQSWAEAWVLLEQINPDYMPDSRHMGALQEEFELLAATVARHRGQVDVSERLYRSLMERITLQDERIADVMLGMAECAHTRTDFDEALRWMRAAQQVPVSSPVLAVRLHTTAAHITSHVNVPKAIELFEWVQANYPAQRDTAWANLLFWHGDALLVDGRYEQSVPLFIQAHKLAVETGATITAADAMRRLPLARILNGQADYALRSMGDLKQAERLYELAGDRGIGYLHTEAGEVYRALGQHREAQSSFKAGLWASRSIQDLNREAHNQIGLFEVSRLTGAPQWDLLDEAARNYDRIDSDWGRLHALICRLLASDNNQEQHLRDAGRLLQQSTFSGFRGERALLSWITKASLEERRAYPHLMNYP